MKGFYLLLTISPFPRLILSRRNVSQYRRELRASAKDNPKRNADGSAQGRNARTLGSK